MSASSRTPINHIAPDTDKIEFEKLLQWVQTHKDLLDKNINIENAIRHVEKLNGVSNNNSAKTDKQAHRYY